MKTFLITFAIVVFGGAIIAFVIEWLPDAVFKFLDDE